MFWDLLQQAGLSGDALVPTSAEDGVWDGLACFGVDWALLEKLRPF